MFAFSYIKVNVNKRSVDSEENGAEPLLDFRLNKSIPVLSTVNRL